MNEKEIETKRVLRNAGWYPGRKIDTSTWPDRLEKSGFTQTEAAEHFLSEFGGLVINQSGSGITCAHELFKFDPLLAEGEDGRFEGWAVYLGEPLSPIEEIYHGRLFLGVSRSSDIYFVENWLASFGSGQNALKALVLEITPTIN